MTNPADHTLTPAEMEALLREEVKRNIRLEKENQLLTGTVRSLIARHIEEQKERIAA